MMLAQQEINPDEDTHNFISYFQSVTTIGIVSRGKSAVEAGKEAKKKLKNSDLTCGIVGQTPFILSTTEEWKPDFSGVIKARNGADALEFDISDKIRYKIAEKLHKNSKDLSDAECTDYIKSIIEKSL